ncbi:MAG: hypothetical protein ACK4NC_03550 [Candidatus Gracilibacteria bacterium]
MLEQKTNLLIHKLGLNNDIEFNQKLNVILEDIKSKYRGLLPDIEYLREEFFELHGQIPSSSVLKYVLPVEREKRRIKHSYFENRKFQNVESYAFNEEGRKEALHIAKQYEEYLVSHIEDAKYTFVSGGVKAPDRIQKRIYEMEEAGTAWIHPTILQVRDIVRGKILGDTLKDNERVMDSLLVNHGNIVSTFNAYYNLYYDWRNPHKPYPKPYVASNITLGFDKNLPYEVQLKTKRADVLDIMTHKVTVAQEIALPPELSDHMESLCYASHILDYQEYFKE